jgi:surfeit locus 1 family protein
VLSHLFVLALVVAMTNLGLWQLRRLDERRTHNELITSRSEAAAADVADIVDPAAPAAGDATYRIATATGTYEADDEVLVVNRSLDGLPGAWVLTPLHLGDGTALVVNRGFVGFDRNGELRPPAPPEGTVGVEGLLLASQHRGRFGPKDQQGGDLTELARADLERLQQQVDDDLFPVYLQLQSSRPGQGELPALLPPPELDEGPHFGYAVQWFIFTTIALIGYPLVLRRVARQERDEAEGAIADRERALADA